MTPAVESRRLSFRSWTERASRRVSPPVSGRSGRQRVVPTRWAAAANVMFLEWSQGPEVLRLSEVTST